MENSPKCLYYLTNCLDFSILLSILFMTFFEKTDTFLVFNINNNSLLWYIFSLK
ncbi:hypothetical protein [Spiroplasma ixodetis]|uniref:hypothetical protein n=1 Tax=Spiroplasma ixodetis TaxID=2141 RepID=UPI002578EC29|nr:hypothetical protein [Spiroplasma ixodetis]